MLLWVVLCVFTPILPPPCMSSHLAHATSAAASRRPQRRVALHEAGLSTSLQGINSLAKQTQPMGQEQTASPTIFPDLRPGQQHCKDPAGLEDTASPCCLHALEGFLVLRGARKALRSP